MLCFYQICCDNFPIVRDVIFFLDGIKLFSDVLRQTGGILFLPVDHPAFEGERILLNSRDGNNLRLHQSQSGLSDLVHVPAAFVPQMANAFLSYPWRGIMFHSFIHYHLNSKVPNIVLFACRFLVIFSF